MTNQPEQEQQETQQEPAQEPETPAPEQETQPEEPQADALASEQEQQEPAQEPEAPATEQEPKPDPKAQKLASEAKRYRLALRETEAKLEALEQENKELEKTLLDHAARDLPALNVKTLIALGFSLNDLRDEKGEFKDPYFQRQVILRFADDHGLKTGYKAVGVPTYGSSVASDDWDSSFKIR